MEQQMQDTAARAEPDMRRVPAPPFPLTARYVNLATRRRDGREVRTPVWFASVAGRLYVFSSADVGKVKRVRAQGRARLAPCTMRGRVTGDWSAARARLATDPATVAAAYAALRAKYGWQMRLLDCLSKLAGRYEARAMIELELE
jgi:PPOX class probable F420-dependent enzyme